MRESSVRQHREKGRKKNSSFIVRAVQEDSQEMREKEMIANLNRENIHSYLKGLEVEKGNEQMANRIVKYSAQKVLSGLKNGIIQIPKSPPPLPKGQSSHRLSSEQARQLQNKAKREAISKKIQYLYDQIRGQGGCQGQKLGNLQVDFKQILTKQQHQRKIRQILQQKQQRRKKMQQLQAEQHRRHQQQQQRKQSLKIIEQTKQRQRKRIKIEQTIKKRQEQHKQFMKMGEKLEQELCMVKNKRRLYEEMQKKYHSQILLPSLEQRKNKLKQIRDFHMRYDVKTIKQHQRSYLEKNKEKSQAIEQSQWKYHPPQQSARMQKVLKDDQAQLKEKMGLRKQKLEEMQKRQQLFKMELKDKYKPKVDQEKKQEIQIRLIQEKRKYQKTHPNIDQRRLGEAYLEMAKRMKRSESVPNPIEQQNKKQLKSKEEQPNKTQVNHTHQFYQQNRRKRMDRIMNSDQSSLTEKCLMLKMESDKLGEKLKQKQQLFKNCPNEQVQGEAGQLLLSSIKAKMGIMSLMSNRKHSSQSDEGI